MSASAVPYIWHAINIHQTTVIFFFCACVTTGLLTGQTFVQGVLRCLKMINSVVNSELEQARGPNP